MERELLLPKDAGRPVRSRTSREGASAPKVAVHDQRMAELAHYKLGRVSATDADGYHRVACPAPLGKLRCALRPVSMALAFSRPEVLASPEHPQACCTQTTITVPASVNQKTAQRHDYPGKAWRLLCEALCGRAGQL